MAGSFSIFQIHHGQYLYQRFETAARGPHETRQIILCCLQTHLKIIRVSCEYYTKILAEGLPHVVTFKRAARELAHNNVATV